MAASTRPFTDLSCSLSLTTQKCPSPPSRLSPLSAKRLIDHECVHRNALRCVTSISYKCRLPALPISCTTGKSIASHNHNQGFFNQVVPHPCFRRRDRERERHQTQAR